jgi:hypothetical protein
MLADMLGVFVASEDAIGAGAVPEKFIGFGAFQSDLIRFAPAVYRPDQYAAGFLAAEVTVDQVILVPFRGSLAIWPGDACRDTSFDGVVG